MTGSVDSMEKAYADGFEGLGVDPSERIRFFPGEEDEEEDDDNALLCGVLMSEKSDARRSDREQMTQIMFETFGVHNFYLQSDMALLLYSTGRTTGTVLDTGYSRLRAGLVYEGHALYHAHQSSEYLSGAALTNTIGQGLGLGPSVEDNTELRRFVEGIKHKHGAVAPEVPRHAPESSAETLTLPDGSIVQLGTTMVDATEHLFCPLKYPGMFQTMQEVVTKSIHLGDVDIRGDLTNSIVIHGGTSLMPGLRDRLENEIKLKLGPGARVKVIQPFCGASVWAGGSILASLSSFSRSWISRGFYDEHGPAAVHRKCF